ncbi:hypothetical protein JY651_33675 [Pyxidicoccus parkwayensis]|uniref:Transposase n=1 Tax=Pyxidicoccus parkwayensis TaxID=2813578 RepID=A0ABX7PDP2_9BACT|nr:hypothetical protein [Pyxidicoccus parkwaysis]QSQ28624.1 hypothetical protein JY651_33675 [Pyxidicoccus parkwaysis]
MDAHRNGCIENPVRGKPLADGDSKMRATQAPIYAQRKGCAAEAWVNVSRLQMQRMI